MAWFKCKECSSLSDTEACSICGGECTLVESKQGEDYLPESDFDDFGESGNSFGSDEWDEEWKEEEEP